MTGDANGIVSVSADGGGDGLQTIQRFTANHTVVAGNLNNLLEFDTEPNDLDITIFVNATLPIGFTLDVVGVGARNVGFASLPGVLLVGRDDRFRLNGNWARARAEYVNTNTWLIDGDLVVGE